MVVSGDFHHRLPPGERARQAERALHRLRAGRVEADALGAGNHLANQAGSLGLDGTLAPEQDAAAKLLFHGAPHVGRRVAEDHRAHAEVVVDQSIAIDVDQIRTVGVIEHQRRG